MPFNDALTLTFTGLLCVATIVYAVLTRLLWKVSRAQKDIQSSMRDLQFLAQKQTLNPGLRAYGNWKCECSPVTQSNGPGTPEVHKVYEIWKASLYLWNTGNSTIWVTGWSLQSESGAPNPRMRPPEGGFEINPPIAVSAHASAHLMAEASGFECRALHVSYDTSAVRGKDLSIPLKTSFGYQNKEESEVDG